MSETKGHCCDLISQLSDYVDGELNAQLCIDLEKHLSECENCRIVINTLRKTIELYHDEPAQAEVDLPLDVRQRLFKCLDLQEYME